MEIKEGYSFHFIFYSLALILFGVILSYFHLIIGISIILLASLLLFDKGGTIFDISAKKIGRYHSLFGKKRYSWTSVVDLKKAELKFEFVSQKMNSKGTTSTIKTKTYPLILEGPINHIIFHEYTNYEHAKNILAILESEFNMTIKDSYAEVQKAALERRNSRRKK